MYQKTRHGPEDLVLPVALLSIVLIVVSPEITMKIMKVGLVALAIGFVTFFVSTGILSLCGKNR